MHFGDLFGEDGKVGLLVGNMNILFKEIGANEANGPGQVTGGVDCFVVIVERRHSAIQDMVKGEQALEIFQGEVRHEVGKAAGHCVAFEL